MTTVREACRAGRDLLAKFAGLMLLVALGFALVTPARAVDPTGTASQTTIPCPSGGAANGECYRIAIKGCPGATIFYARAKLNTTTAAQAIGTVLLTTGGGGNSWYDNDPQFKIASNCTGNCGLQTVTDLNAAGYNTIQTNFSDLNQVAPEVAGWLTGSTTTPNGPRELACRYATVANWAWTFLLGGDTSKPVCATGNSAGSAAIAYALSQYQLGSKAGPGPDFRMAEMTSGPPLSRLDHACLGKKAPKPVVQCPLTTPPTTLSENIGVIDAEKVVDPSYDGDLDCSSLSSCQPDATDICGNSILSGGPADPTLLHDSILSDTDPPILSYDTNVNVVFGDHDLTAAVPLGQEWFNAVTSQKSQACVAGPHHNLPGYTAGEQQIVADLTSLCK